MKIRMKRRGQVLIMVGVVLSLLILSVAVTLYMDQLQFSQFQVSTYNSAILNISDDFNRVLTNILASSTLTYNDSSDITTPRAWANTNFTIWASSIQKEFSATGIQSNFYLTNLSLGTDRYLATSTNNDIYVFTDNSLIKLLWYAPNSISAISAGYNISLPGQSVYGIRNIQVVLLNTSLGGISVSNTFYRTQPNNTTVVKTSFNVTVLRENQIPVDDLSAANFKITFFNLTTNEWNTASNVNVTNLAGGLYNVSFDTKWYGLNSYMNQIVTKDMKYFILWVTDNRGIMTESYSYTSVSYVLHQQALPQTSTKDYETYVLESISNGSVFWFNHLLNFSSNVAPAPIPIPPVKQLRVYTNVTGSNPVPSQVEVWDSKYSVPTLEFANWRNRFELGDKLVYEVTFNKNVNNVNVTITWLTDADAQPPVFRLSFGQSANEWIVNNGQYSLGLVTNSNLANYEPGTNWIDYNLQVNATFTNGIYYPNGSKMSPTLYTPNGAYFPNGAYYPVAYIDSTSGSLLNVTCMQSPPGKYIPGSNLPAGAYFPNGTSSASQIDLTPNEYACTNTGAAINGTSLSAGNLPAGTFLTTGVITSYLVMPNGSKSLSTGYFTPATYNPWGYHVEYTLFGYDAYPMPGGGTWFPAKMPWGPGANEGWTVLPGPVRAVAYRVSDFSYEPPTNTTFCSTGEPGCPTNHQPADFLFIQIILIPYNVSYFESYLTAKALRNVPFQEQYVSIVGMIAGTERDASLSNTIRPSWASFQCVSGSTQNLYNGSYSSNFAFHIYISDADCARSSQTPMAIGYWAALYSQNRGQAIFLDSNTYNSLASAAQHAYWFWTTADGQRRVAEYDYAFWNSGSSNYQIPVNTVISASFAGWIYQQSLGTPINSYAAPTIWQNGYLYRNALGAAIPSTYYKMFLLPYYPVITGVQTG